MPVPKELDQSVGGDNRTIRERVLQIGEVDDDKRPVVVEGLKSLVLERFRQSRYADPIFHLSTPEEVQQAFEILKGRLIPVDESSRLRDWKSLEILLLLNHFSLEGKKPASQTELARMLDVSQSTISIHQRQMLAMIDFPTTFYSTDFKPKVVEFETHNGRPNLERIKSPKLNDSEKPQIRTLAIDYMNTIIDSPVFQRLCAQAFWFGQEESYFFDQTEFHYGLSNGGQFPDRKLVDPIDRVTRRLSYHFTMTRERLDWDSGTVSTGEEIKFETFGHNAASNHVYYEYLNSGDSEVYMKLGDTHFSLEKAQEILADFKQGK